jgi:hypothetical protein
MTANNTLDIELKNRAEGSNKEAEGLWYKFNVMKEYLDREYYPWVQAECPYYTDHGRVHIESVIQSASLLLSERLSQEKDIHLSSLEIFIVLTAILWHDAGMVYGRSGHADQVVQIIDKIKEVCLSDVTICRIVTEIVKAHSGQDGLKIPKREEDCTGPSLGACTIYPKALAALIRFSDEISENRSRISGALLPNVPEDQKIFWEYANCVTAARPDPARHRIVLSLEIPYDKAIKDYKCKHFKDLAGNSGKISLIEYIVRRIEKMNNERAYCAPHFNKYAWIGEICVRFKIINGMSNPDAFEIEKIFSDPDSAIPSIDIFERFFNENPEWRPDQLKRKQKK